MGCNTILKLSRLPYEDSHQEVCNVALPAYSIDKQATW